MFGFAHVFLFSTEDGRTAFVDIYNSTANNWTRLSAGLGQARSGLAAASLLLSGLVFFAGGVTSGSVKQTVFLQLWRMNLFRTAELTLQYCAVSQDCFFLGLLRRVWKHWNC
jgi:hypothetical protein